VPVPFGKYLGNARASASELRVGADSVVMTLAPFTHLYGLFSIDLSLGAGARIAILPAFTPQALSAALAVQRPTVLMTAPAHAPGRAANLRGPCLGRASADFWKRLPA